ncbi:hypothetical protein ACSQ67_010772 [Phaseolus vulgaris]
MGFNEISFNFSSCESLIWKIPKHLGNFTSLRYLYVPSFNSIQSYVLDIIMFIEILKNEVYFESVIVVVCGLSSLLTSSFVLSPIRMLEANQFFGAVPPELGKLINLETL